MVLCEGVGNGVNVLEEMETVLMEDKVEGEDVVVAFVVGMAAEDIGTETEALIADVEDLGIETEETGATELGTEAEETGIGELMKDLVREEVVKAELSDTRDDPVEVETTAVETADAEDVALTDSEAALTQGTRMKSPFKSPFEATMEFSFEGSVHNEIIDRQLLKVNSEFSWTGDETDRECLCNIHVHV
ncbi:hypothetical protein C0989_001781 [Termitomyces sp. Mn162]|nr:hypothetical protein C0989_001781 [Termitomyces sp. Mn162]